MKKKPDEKKIGNDLRTQKRRKKCHKDPQPARKEEKKREKKEQEIDVCREKKRPKQKQRITSYTRKDLKKKKERKKKERKKEKKKKTKETKKKVEKKEIYKGRNTHSPSPTALEYKNTHKKKKDF